MRNNAMQVAGKLILSAAIAFTTLCASAQGTDPAAPTPRRDLLRAASPTSVLAIERLEAKRGSPIGDDEIAKVVQTEDFRLEHEKAVSEFCAAPENKNVLRCLEKRGRPFWNKPTWAVENNNALLYQLLDRLNA